MLLLGTVVRFPFMKHCSALAEGPGDELELAYVAFDGSDANVEVLIRLVKERLQLFSPEESGRWPWHVTPSPQ